MISSYMQEISLLKFATSLRCDSGNPVVDVVCPGHIQLKNARQHDVAIL
jgi:hypothetical protein